MNVIQIRKQTRRAIIEKIVASLKTSMEKSGDKEYNFDYESILVAIQAQTYCSRRTAMEYANIALYKIGLTRADLSDAPQDTKQKRLEM